MSDPEWTPPDDAQRAVLERLRVFLRQFGSANDAQDHDAAAEAARLRRTASAGIRELLCEQPFLAEQFPTLAAALGTWRLEAFGWSELTDAVEERLHFVHVDLIPWERVVHFRGRAGEVRDWIAELTRDSHAAAEERLRDCLVRDDGVAQATPLALRLMLGALRFGMLKDAAAVRGIVERIDAAARRQIEAAARSGTRAPRADWSLYWKDRLWPPFESAARDKALWQAWRPSAEEALGWALLTRHVIDEHERLAAAGRAPRQE